MNQIKICPPNKRTKKWKKAYELMSDISSLAVAFNEIARTDKKEDFIWADDYALEIMRSNLVDLFYKNLRSDDIISLAPRMSVYERKNV